MRPDWRMYILHAISAMLPIARMLPHGRMFGVFGYLDGVTCAGDAQQPRADI